MIYSIKNKEDLKDLEKLEVIQPKVKQDRLVEKLSKQGYHYDIKELFEPITKTVRDTNQKLLEEAKSNTKAIENLDETNDYVKSSESMNEIEIIQSNLIRLIAKLLEPENKSQFRLLEDPDSDNWNEYKLNREKVSLYDDKLVFSDIGLVFAVKGDFLSLLTDLDSIKPQSPDAKQNISFCDEMHFNTRTTGKSKRDIKLIEKLI